MHSFPLPPSANTYWRYARGKVIVNPVAVNYKQTVKMLARVDQVTALTGPVSLTVAIFRERRSGDLDNFLKILIDAMQGVFYRNDSQIREIHATLHEDKHEPRCEVMVTRYQAPTDDWANVCMPDRTD